MQAIKSILPVEPSANVDLLKLSSKIVGDLTGQVVVVLGGTGVIGQAVIGELFKHGAAVAVVSRTEDKIDTLANKLSGVRAAIADENTGLFPFVAKNADATSINALNEISDRVLDNLGKITSLVCLVGGNRPATTVAPENNPFDVSYEEFQQTLDLNFRDGFYNPARVIGQKMIDGLTQHNQNVSIIGTSSMAALTPLSKVGAYGAAKAAMANYATWLAGHLGNQYGDRVRVNLVTPGFILAEQNRALLLEKDGVTPTPRGASVLNHSMFKRFGEAKEIAAAYVMLLSQSASFITGTEFVVDGGYSKKTI